MRIAIAQIEAVNGNLEKNIGNHVKWIKHAIQKNAEMVVFPELSLTGYEPDLAESLATHQDDSRLDEMQRLSDKHNITIGAGLPTKKEKEVFVSMVIFQPHKERITYSKQYLYPPEKSVFTAGKIQLVLKIGTEVVSPAICYETTNQAHCEYASQHHATIYAASVLSSIGGIDSELAILSDIARNKKMVACMANYVGKSGGYECAGKSSVWDEQGEIIGQLGGEEEGILIFDTKTREVLTLTDILISACQNTNT